MSTTDARKWLQDNGYKVKPKGRIPADLLAIYQAKLKKGKLASVSADSPATDPDDVVGKKTNVKRTSCGFCTVNAPHQHKYCPGSIDQGKLGVWTCLCFEKEHTLHVLHL